MHNEFCRDATCKGCETIRISLCYANYSDRCRDNFRCDWPVCNGR